MKKSGLSDIFKKAGWPVLLGAAMACAVPGKVDPETQAPASQDDSTPVAPAWGQVAGGPETDCATGTPFSFFVRPGDPRRVMVYFQGGGACWDGATCDTHGDRLSFDPAVDAKDNPAHSATGIMDLANPANPVRDYTVVFVPYCTADAFLGDRTLTYTAPSGRVFDIHHNGAANARSALGWVYENLAGPDVIFVAGSSAGAVASPLYAAELALRYPEARVVQLGDAAGGYRAPPIPQLLARAGIRDAMDKHPAVRAAHDDSLTYPFLYAAAAREAPHVLFAQFDTAEDAVQTGFSRMLGVNPVTLGRLIAENRKEIADQAPRFRAYTAPGSEHTILPRPEFYSLAVGGVKLRDWLDDMLAGRPVRDVGSALLPVPRP